MIAVSKLRIATAVGVTVFAALLLLGVAASAPEANAGVWAWFRVIARSLSVAAVGSTAIVGSLTLFVAGVWVWVRTVKAFGQVPRWHYGWILDPAVLSDEGKSARLWLFRVYGSLALIGLLAHILQRIGQL